MIIVYTTGVFDLLHPGHLSILKHARALGDKLVVGVQEDDSVEAQKGTRPVMSCNQRMTMVEALPFVDVVVSYKKIDQSDMLKMIKPDIMAQTESWLVGTSRKKTIEYLHRHHIRLVLFPLTFPYTQGISSSIIRSRAAANLQAPSQATADNKSFYKRLSLLPISQLRTYEKSDSERVEQIRMNLMKYQEFLNPITVAKVTNRSEYIVIDGANRLDALKKVGAKTVLAQAVSYFNPHEITLTGNEHYIDCKPADFIKQLKNNGLTLEKVSRSLPPVSFVSARTICVITMSKVTYRIIAGSDLDNRVETLNAIVNSYKGTYKILRKSEMGETPDFKGIRIQFIPLSTGDIVELTFRNKTLESGITWHKPALTIARFKIPLSILMRSYATEKQAQKILSDIITKKIDAHSIRSYTSSVYVCDEWDV